MKKEICSLLLFGLSMFPNPKKNLGEEHELRLRNKEVFASMLEEKDYNYFNKTEILSKYIQNIKPPKYSSAGFEECQRYLRESAYKLFNKNYSWGHAWNMKYHDKIVSYVNGSSDIYDLIIKEIMKPGMVVGFYNPKSRYKYKKDEKRKKAEFTHVALYVGVNGKLEPEFIHQEEWRRKKSTLKQMCKSGYSPMIVLDELDVKKETNEPKTHLDEMVCLSGRN